MQKVSVLNALLLAFLAGCSNLERSNGERALENWDNQTILANIYRNYLLPTAYSVYQDDEEDFNDIGLELADVAGSNAFCEMNQIKISSARKDLELIYELWAKGKGKNKDWVVSKYGYQAYESAVRIFSDSSSKCLLITFKWIEEHKKSSTN